VKVMPVESVDAKYNLRELASQISVTIPTARMYARFILGGPDSYEWRVFKTGRGRRRAKIGLYTPAQVKQIKDAMGRA